ncbi:MAG: chemotaxis protein CheA [Desulfobacterales bacterium]|nr:chemotaxis protein CheA [Desulfobacterales bacterium]MCP4162332.1 chemotaxis protein CheA [Deltaproteobacteria bacterium]
MENSATKIKEIINSVSESAASLDPTDIPTLGMMMNELNNVIEISDKEDNLSLPSKVSKAINGYIEKLILDETDDEKPLLDGISSLKGHIDAIVDGGDQSFDETVLNNLLGEKAKEKETVVEDSGISDDDIEILNDFIIEANESLESIELDLINLEQNPDDTEILNSIFRPFHTIKGVSGFLNLSKINSLSHSTENLLDSARLGKLVIDQDITDIILESVDTLKILLDRVSDGIAKKSIDDEDINVDNLISLIAKSEKKAVMSEDTPLGEIMVENGSLSEEDLVKGLELQKSSDDKRLGEILIESKAVKSKEVISAIRDQKKLKKTIGSQVKVDTSKLDNLVDLTGELVIAQSILKQNALSEEQDKQGTSQSLSQLGQIVSSIQKIAMSMRMVPVNNTFQKMVRLIRDLANNSGKKVALKMSGEETEIDRNVVEVLYEPMVHMIRNSVDHGIESPSERQAKGKPENGTINLKASHRGGNIIINIEDDGKGLSKEKIYNKAVKTGVIPENAKLTDSETFELIMKPGFSTADKITDISGRGVGMDVVKKAIENLRGKIDIASKENEGSVFTITLPLTLAIIEGMLVRVSGDRFIIPTLAILETFKLEKKDFYTVEGKGEMIMFRNSLVPLIRIDSMFCSVKEPVTPWDGIIVVTENKEQQRALLINELLGKEEFVIKSLGETLQDIKGFAGGTILSDGQIGLIFDISELFEIALA